MRNSTLRACESCWPSIRRFVTHLVEPAGIARAVKSAIPWRCFSDFLIQVYYATGIRRFECREINLVENVELVRKNRIYDAANMFSYG